MENTITIRKAAHKDAETITKLLQEAGILSDGVEQSAESFILAETCTAGGTEVAAAVGYEKYGSVGLLRSFVIRKKAWKPDSTVQLLGLVLAHARDSGVQAVYLVTQSPTLFIHMGFEVLEQDLIPAELLQSRHFSRNLKQGVAMRKVLD